MIPMHASINMSNISIFQNFHVRNRSSVMLNSYQLYNSHANIIHTVVRLNILADCIFSSPLHTFTYISCIQSNNPIFVCCHCIKLHIHELYSFVYAKKLSCKWLTWTASISSSSWYPASQWEQVTWQYSDYPRIHTACRMHATISRPHVIGLVITKRTQVFFMRREA